MNHRLLHRWAREEALPLPSRTHSQTQKQTSAIYTEELTDLSFAHAYETGGMRRLHLRGRENILKRLLIHMGGFNLSLVMRQLLGKGTPRAWQGFSTDAVLTFLRLWLALLAHSDEQNVSLTMPVSAHASSADISMSLSPQRRETTCATDC